jgi:hypothetical protein
MKLSSAGLQQRLLDAGQILEWPPRAGTKEIKKGNEKRFPVSAEMPLNEGSSYGH